MPSALKSPKKKSPIPTKAATTENIFAVEGSVRDASDWYTMTKIIEVYCRTIALPTDVSWLAKLNVVPVTKLQTATRTIKRLMRSLGLPTNKMNSAMNIAVTDPIKRADCELA